MFPKTTFVEFSSLLDKLLRSSSWSTNIKISRSKATYVVKPNEFVVLTPTSYRDGTALKARLEVR